ncbi:MAG: HAAS signaling domain-containing protein [Emergencia sp.]
MDKKNKAIEQYLDKIKAQIYRLSPAEEFINALRQDLYEYAEANSDCTEEDLESEFGTPEEIARDFLREHPSLQPKAVVKGRRIRNIIILILITVLVAGGFIFADFLGQRQVKATQVVVIED